MVFGLARNDSNFQTLDESCAFSCFDDSETCAGSTANEDQVRPGQHYLGGKDLLPSLGAPDYVEEDSDSNLQFSLIPYLKNSSSMSKGQHGEHEMTRTVLRCPSIERHSTFEVTQNDNDSESSDSMDDCSNSNAEPVQLEIPGITRALTPNKNQIGLDSLLKSDEGSMKDLQNCDASISFTTCFDFSTEEVVSKPTTIILTLENVSIDIMELESLGIVDKNTVQKIRAHLLEKQGSTPTELSSTQAQSIIDPNIRKQRRRTPPSQRSSTPTGNANTATISEAKTFSNCSNGDRQSERTERRKSKYSSPDRNKAQDEKVGNIVIKNTELSRESNVSPSPQCTNVEQQSLNRGIKDRNHPVIAVNPNAKRSKSRPSKSVAVVESKDSPVNTNLRICDDNITTNIRKPRRSNSMSSVETFRRVDTGNKSEPLFIESVLAPTRSETSSCEFSGKIDNLHDCARQHVSDVSSPTGTKKQVSLLGNTGKMMKKFLSSRNIVQEKERPTNYLVKAESQAILGSPRRGHDNTSTDDLTEFNGHLLKGTAPFTPRSQKRFLNWRTNGAKKSLNTFGGHLIEGELDIVDVVDIGFPNESDEIKKHPQREGSELTVKNSISVPAITGGESKVTSEVGDKIINTEDHLRMAVSGIRKGTSRVIREPPNHGNYLPKEGKHDLDLIQTNEKGRQSISPPKGSRSSTNTTPKQNIRRMSMSDNRSTNVKDRKSDVRTTSTNASDHSKSASTAYASKSANAKEEFVSSPVADNRTSSPAKSKSSMSRGLSQSVHVSPTKKLGKGSSTGVTRRQRILASTLQDDMPLSFMNSMQPHNLSDIDVNRSMTPELSIPLSEPFVQSEEIDLQSSIDLATMNQDLVGDSRQHKNISQSLHVSSLKKKGGKNIEIALDSPLVPEMSFKSKLQSKVPSKMESRSGVDIDTEKRDNDHKPMASARARKTTCEELRKEFVFQNTNGDNSAETVGDETVVRKRRNSIGIPILKILNNKAP